MVKKWNQEHPDAIIPKPTKYQSIEDQARKTPKGFKYY